MVKTLNRYFPTDGILESSKPKGGAQLQPSGECKLKSPVRFPFPTTMASAVAKIECTKCW